MHAITILGVLAAFSLLFLSLLALCAARGFRPLTGVGRFYGRLPVLGRVLLLVFVGAFIVYASTKSDGDESSTNAPPARMAAQRRSLAVQPGVVISEAETNLGYRVLAVRDGDEIVPPGIEAVTNEAWRLRGGMMDAFRIGMGPESTEEDWMLQTGPVWSFPWRAAWTQGLTVFANGEFQPSVRDDFFPRPFGTNLSLVPQAKWGEIADGSLESLFWHELTPSNSLVLTWQNALYGRDANAPTNFQAELFGDGSFDYRYPDRTVSYAPVFPFDWDGDGLENSVDPEPRVAGPDAHGTNAEWYNNVCSNVFVAVEGTDGLTLAPRHAGVNTNAYYFVDVVAERGPAPIYFTADGESDLGSPVVVAYAGVHHAVPLLIGVSYNVSSPVPFSVNPLYGAPVEMDYDSGPSCIIRWPVPISFFTQNEKTRPLVPSQLAQKLNGVFSWGNGCCMLVTDDEFSFQCHSCRCRGCNAVASYSYAGYRLSRSGPSCGCSSIGNDAVDSDHPYVLADSGVRLSVWFDKQALLFEDEYDESPGVTVGRRSSPVVLTVQAEGGDAGGTLEVQLKDSGRLFRAAGDVLPAVPIALSAGESVAYSATYEALSRSRRENDISVNVRLTEVGGSSSRIDCTVAMTAVELELTADKVAPQNPSRHRHGYGVRERVSARQRPSSPIVEWQADDWTVQQSEPIGLVCPLVAVNRGGRVSARCLDAVYNFDVAVFNPTGVFSRASEVAWHFRPDRVHGDLVPGILGTGMRVPVYVGPMEVSFEGIAIAELQCSTGTHSGMFDDARWSDGWSHTAQNGAGYYYAVKPGNMWFADEPQFAIWQLESPFAWGRIVWDIPIGWNEIGTERLAECAARIPSDNIKQVITVEADGSCSISKFGQCTGRTIRDERSINGVVVKRGVDQ